MKTLQAKGVSKSFGGLKALSDVSIEVRPGEIHGLIGPNGSGKTTLLNMICGYYRVDDGRILLGDEDLTGQDIQTRARLGIARTFQKPRLLQDLTVLENAMLGAWTDHEASFLETAFALPRNRKDESRSRDYARELLHGVGLGYAVDRRANLLEHGEQRFLEVARALALRPRFVLLDEPAGGLTDHEIDSLERIVLTLKDAGIGVLIVEHHTDFVFRISDRVTVLHLGRLLKHGDPHTVETDQEVINVYLGA
jgi:branched-chain amino acid transport system ATP-binding protein